MNEEIKYAQMNGVVIKKEELIAILKDNKDKHDAIFTAALEGYWDNAKVKIEEKRKSYNKALKALNQRVERQFEDFSKSIDSKEKLDDNCFINVTMDFQTYLGVVYPQNHTKEYEKAIRKLELSIYDTVTLSEKEYNMYVLNEWDWRENFLASNVSLAKSRNRVLYATGGVLSGNAPVSSAMLTGGESVIKVGKYDENYLTNLVDGKEKF